MARKPIYVVANDMKSGLGTQELTRLAIAWFASIAFGVTFLVATACGVAGGTALLRGITAAGIAMVAGWLLAPPALDVVLAAMARDEARRKAESGEEDEA